MKFKEYLKEGKYTSLWKAIPSSGKVSMIKSTKKPKFKKNFEELENKKQITTGMLDTFNITMDSFLIYSQLPDKFQKIYVEKLIDLLEAAIEASK